MRLIPGAGLALERQLVRQGPNPRREPRREDALHGHRAAGGVAKYLGPVTHANVEDLDFDPFRVTYLLGHGGAPQGPPTEQPFWAASASGVGTQTLTWKVREGDWSVVLMNADGSRGVAADIDVGAKLSFLLWVAIGLLLGGALVTGGKHRIGRPGRAETAAAACAADPTESRGPGTTPTPEPPDASTEQPPPSFLTLSSVRPKPETGLLGVPGATETIRSEASEPLDRIFVAFGHEERAGRRAERLGRLPRPGPMRAYEASSSYAAFGLVLHDRTGGASASSSRL